MVPLTLGYATNVECNVLRSEGIYGYLRVAGTALSTACIDTQGLAVVIAAKERQLYAA